jgi:hypothetical protein
MQTTIIDSKGVAGSGSETIPVTETEALANETQAVEEQSAKTCEAEVPAQEVEEIDSAKPEPKAVPAKKPVKKEPDPNPVLEDPYEWHKCTITVVRALLPDGTVSVSVLNHKDEPIVRTFPKADALLSDDVEQVAETMRTIWKDVTISTTLAFLPVASETDERTVVISTRPGSDTPVVNAVKESELILPTSITQMLDELKSALPARALAKLDKDAKARKPSVTNKTAKTKPGTLTSKKPVAPSKPNPHQNNLTLF